MSMISLVASEFPLHAIAVQAVSASRLLARGAIRDKCGLAALVLAVGAWSRLLAARRDQLNSGQVLEESLRISLGEAYQSRTALRPRADPRLTLRETWFPRFTERRSYLYRSNLSYGDFGVRNNLDIWRSQDLPRDARAPVLIQIHGSAWVKGSKRGQGYPLMAHMAKCGWVCVAINYSLAPAARWPAHIVDVKRAIAWVKREITKYGGEPNFIAVTGGSAGGHLSALAALTANDPIFQPEFEDADTAVHAAIPLYGVYDFLDRAGDSPAEQEKFLSKIVIGTTRAESRGIWDLASPLSHVRSDAPPFFIVHGSIDTFTNHEQARAFASELRAVSHNPVAYAELPGAQHSFDTLPSARTAATVSAIERFLTSVRAPSDKTAAAARLDTSTYEELGTTQRSDEKHRAQRRSG